MSIPVALAELAKAAADRDFAYLVSIGEDGTAHVVAVQPVVADEAISISGLGRRSAANVADRPRVTLVWPPRSADGYSLISDGLASVGAGDGSITIVPSRAVLHRSAPADAETPADAEACGNDCAEVTLSTPAGPAGPT